MSHDFWKFMVHEFFEAAKIDILPTYLLMFNKIFVSKGKYSRMQLGFI